MLASIWTMPFGAADTTVSRTSWSAKAGALSNWRICSGMSALTRWWPAVATVSPSVKGRPSKLRWSACADPWRRTLFAAGAKTTRVAGLDTALRTSTKSPDPTPALARWSPSRRRMSSPSSSPYGRIARAAVERLPTISITSPSASPISVISLTGSRATPRPLSAGGRLATCTRRIIVSASAILIPLSKIPAKQTAAGRRGSMWESGGQKKGRTLPSGRGRGEIALRRRLYCSAAFILQVRSDATPTTGSG